MADVGDPSQPLSPDRAKRLARAIMEDGTVLTPSHAQRRMDQRSITTQDIENTLVGGVCVLAEWNQQREQWRYRFETSRIGVVISFDDEQCFTVVTTWRKT